MGQGPVVVGREDVVAHGPILPDRFGAGNPGTVRRGVSRLSVALRRGVRGA